MAGLWAYCIPLPILGFTHFHAFAILVCLCFPFKAFPACLALTRHLTALVLTPLHSVTRARCPLAVSHPPRFQSVPKNRFRCQGSTLSSIRGLNLKALIQTNSAFSSNCVSADRGAVALLGFLLRLPNLKIRIGTPYLLGCLQKTEVCQLLQP
jgi:hypothetical protein